MPDGYVGSVRRPAGRFGRETALPFTRAFIPFTAASVQLVGPVRIHRARRGSAITPPPEVAPEDARAALAKLRPLLNAVWTRSQGDLLPDGGAAAADQHDLYGRAGYRLPLQPIPNRKPGVWGVYPPRMPTAGDRPAGARSARRR